MAVVTVLITTLSSQSCASSNIPCSRISSILPIVQPAATRQTRAIVRVICTKSAGHGLGRAWLVGIREPHGGIRIPEGLRPRMGYRTEIGGRRIEFAGFQMRVGRTPETEIH